MINYWGMIFISTLLLLSCGCILNKLLQLVPVCFNFFSLKSIFWKKPAQKVCFISIKRNFLEKVAFYTCEENAHSLKGAIQVHFAKSPCTLSYIRWGELGNYQITLNKLCSCLQFSRLFLIPLVSSLCLCLEVHSCLSSLLSALPSPCCYKPLRGKSLSFLLSSVESSSSSSSFFVLFNARSSVFFFLNFICLI